VNKELFELCSMGSLNGIEKLLLKGADLNCIDDKEKITPLYLAAILGNMELVEFIVVKGGNVNSWNNGNTSPLHAACHVKNDAIVEFLVVNGAELHKKSELGVSPFHMVCFRDDASLLNNLLKLPKITERINVHERGVNDYTPLHYAVAGGSKEIAVTLLDLGAEPNAVDHNEMTALHLACSSGRSDIGKALLRRGASVAMIDSEGRSALYYYCLCGDTAEFVDEMFNRGADVHATESGGSTLLHAACECGSLSVVQLLFQRGLSFSSKNRIGVTPLDVVLEGKQTDLFDWVQKNIVKKK